MGIIQQLLICDWINSKGNSYASFHRSDTIQVFTGSLMNWKRCTFSGNIADPKRKVFKNENGVIPLRNTIRHIVSHTYKPLLIKYLAKTRTYSYTFSGGPVAWPSQRPSLSMIAMCRGGLALTAPWSTDLSMKRVPWSPANGFGTSRTWRKPLPGEAVTRTRCLPTATSIPVPR